MQQLIERERERERVFVCVYVCVQPTQKTRDPSVKVQGNWEVVHEIEFSQLSKLHFMPATPEEL